MRGLAAALCLLTVAAGCGAKSSPSQPASSTGPSSGSRGQPSVTLRLLGLPPVPSNSPLPGYLMVADRDNRRLLVVSPDKRVVWRFPTPGDLRAGQSFGGPDDAFLTPDGRGIITNEEFSDVIAIIGLGS